MSEVYKIQVNDSEPIEVSQQVYEVSFCFNEMLKEKDKEIERLNKELEEANESIEWWSNRFNAVERDNERLNNILNELEKWLKFFNENGLVIDLEEGKQTTVMPTLAVLEKIQELKGSNEPSFEEMVGFVENVCKDIKSQPTLHEELEEERKRIAKIVGDFKEVNK